MDEPINLVLFSGTDDKLQAAAVLTAGAAALGKPVNVFLQYWALDAFRAERIDRDHGLAPEAGAEGKGHVEALRIAGQASWAETLRQAKDLGSGRDQRLREGITRIAIEESKRQGWTLSEERLLKVLGHDIELNAQGLGDWLDTLA